MSHDNESSCSTPRDIFLGQLLGNERASLVALIRHAAEYYGINAYLVGGIVRDTLLGLPARTNDIDIMVSQDVRGFLEFLLERWEDFVPEFSIPTRVTHFHRFLTGKLHFVEPLLSGVHSLDFSQARKEEYPEPGDEPVVTAGDLTTDMRRRDFSVNALAIRLERGTKGTLIDIVDGMSDLSAKSLRILHEDSFLDDPARLIRAVRYRLRLGFEYDELTWAQYTSAVSSEYIKSLPAARYFHELKKAFSESSPIEIVEELYCDGLLEMAFPALEELKAREQVLSAALEWESKVSLEQWERVCLALWSAVDETTFGEMLDIFGIQGRRRRRLHKAWEEFRFRHGPH